MPVPIGTGIFDANKKDPLHKSEKSLEMYLDLSVWRTGVHDEHLSDHTFSVQSSVGHE